MPIHKNRLRTKFRRRAQRHGRMHAEPPRCVGCGRDYSSFVALSAYDYRFAFQRWIEQFFYGDEEGVHIDMKDGAWGGAHRSRRGPAGSVSREALWARIVVADDEN